VAAPTAFADFLQPELALLYLLVFLVLIPNISLDLLEIQTNCIYAVSFGPEVITPVRLLP
jgi:hypothetical protein